MQGQISLFEFIKADEMYDGYRVKLSKVILDTCGTRTKLIKDNICYFIARSGKIVNIAFPNEYGGSYGITVTERQFKDLFEKLNRKIYPASKEIWTGTRWIHNPRLFTWAQLQGE